MATSRSFGQTIFFRVLSVAVVGCLTAFVLVVTRDVRIEQDAIDEIQSIQTSEAETSTDLNSKHDVAAPSVLIARAELMMREGPENYEMSAQLIERAVILDPSRPFAWSLLSLLYSEIDGTFSQRAEAALATSLDQCLLCDKNLIKWRLEFVIGNWRQASEETRLRVFEGADYLRWWYLDMEYLNTLSVRSERIGVLFREYQRRIDTPIRPHEIGR